MICLESTVQRSDDVIAAEADRDIVMVSITRGSYYGVSDVAREVWEKLEQPKKVSDLVESLVAHYDVDRALCEEQTLAFLTELNSAQLISVSDDPSS